MEHTDISIGSYGIHDTLKSGPSHALSKTISHHPLEKSEKIHYKRLEQQEFSSARNIQGLHMPMKLQMERRIVSRIQRLPGLPSSHLALRTLMDHSSFIGPEDIFNDVSENMVDYRALGDKVMGL